MDDSFKSAFTEKIVQNADTEGSVGLLGIGGKGGSKSEWSGDGNGDGGEANDGVNGSDGSGRRDKQEITYNKHRYVLMIGRLSWTKAKKYAEDCGGHLATITSVGENSVIKQMIINSGLSDVWIGAENTSGKYVWVTGEKWEYTSWAPSEPSGGNEHYLGYKDGGSDWNDYTESSSLVAGFIVEFE